MKTLEGLSAAERMIRLEKEADREGKVRWTTSANLDRIRPVVEAWRRKYPRVDIEYNQLSGRVLADRMIREYRAGNYELDDLDFASIPFLSLKEAGVIRSYFSPHSATIKSGMKDEKGRRKKEKPEGEEELSWNPEIAEVGPPPVSKESKKCWSYFIRKVYETDPLACPKMSRRDARHQLY